MEKRVLGRTGHKSTLITLGGAAARPTGSSSNAPRASREESEAFIKFALDHGVNHVDVAPTYGGGEAEDILGKWVKEYRKDLFVGCKTQKRTGKDAAEELRRSLKRLQTDYLDLYQLHGLDELDELKTALCEGGAVEAILEAKKQGLVKYIGITSHNPVTILEALKGFDFDTVLLPVNYVLRAHREPGNDYEPVLSLTKERNLGVIAMKSMAKRPWPTAARTHLCWYQPFATREDVAEALRFTLSQSVTTAASCSDIRVARMMLDAVEHFSPMSEKEQQMLLLKAQSPECLPLFPRH